MMVCTRPPRVVLHLPLSLTLVRAHSSPSVKIGCPSCLSSRAQYSTLSFAAGISGSDVTSTVPPADSRNMFPAWSALLRSRQGLGASMLELHGGRREVVLDARSASQALIDVGQRAGKPPHAFKMLKGRICYGDPDYGHPCIEACKDGCIYDVLNDPTESNNLIGTGELSAQRIRKLHRALADALQSAWQAPADDPKNPSDCNYSTVVAFATSNGGVIQPWLQ